MYLLRLNHYAANSEPDKGLLSSFLPISGMSQGRWHPVDAFSKRHGVSVTGCYRPRTARNPRQGQFPVSGAGFVTAVAVGFDPTVELPPPTLSSSANPVSSATVDVRVVLTKTAGGSGQTLPDGDNCANGATPFRTKRKWTPLALPQRRRIPASQPRPPRRGRLVGA